MPKDVAKSKWRKGTHSCIACRQRKLKCLPADDGSQPCQNCAARNRPCILQTDADHSESSGITSRERIASLESTTSQLWDVVRRMQGELGHAQDVPHDDTNSVAGQSIESTEASPLNPPTHLRQLFDNEFVDTEANAGTVSTVGSDRVSGALATKARSRLQPLIPSKEDIRILCGSTSQLNWIQIYASLFPTINMFNSAHEMIAQHDALSTAVANPVTIAALLATIAIILLHRPSDSAVIPGISDTAVWIRTANDAIEHAVVREDDLVCSVEGIETILLFVRLQLARVQTRKLWIMLRRVVALAELIGVPRAAQRSSNMNTGQESSSNDGSGDVSTSNSAAALWKSICSIDRLVGTMFNLPFGTSMYGFPAPLTVMSGSEVNPQEFFSYVAVIAAKVQDIDDSYMSQRPQIELAEKVWKIESELRVLHGMTPSDWWNLTQQSRLVDHVLQYWYYYFTVRTHLQLALRGGADSRNTYSYLACYQAARNLAQRYVKLRGLLPPAFFAGRVLDLQALTGAVVLLFTSQRQTTGQGMTIQDEGGPASLELVHGMIQTMESVASQPASQPTGVFSRQAAPALRALSELMSNSSGPNSKSLTLQIPMLGKINVSRHGRTSQLSTNGSQYVQTSSLPASLPYSGQTTLGAAQAADWTTSGFVSNDQFDWSLMMGGDLSYPEDAYGIDPWMSYTWDSTGF